MLGCLSGYQIFRGHGVLEMRQAVQTFRDNKTTQMLPFKLSNCRGTSLTVGNNWNTNKELLQTKQLLSSGFLVLFQVFICNQIVSWKIYKLWDKHLEDGIQNDSHSMYNYYNQISLCTWTPAVPLSCSVLRVGKYQLSFTAAPAQAMGGILFFFPTMGKEPLIKKFKGNCLLHVHFQLWFILSLPCKNNLVSPMEKKK